MKNPVRTLLPDPTVKPSLNLLYGPPLEVAPEHIKCEFCKKYLMRRVKTPLGSAL